MSQIMNGNRTAQPSLLAFPDERPVFLREYSTNHYSVISYFVCRLILEASVTFVQIWVAVIVTYHLLAVTMNIFLFFAIIYVLAMASTAVAVLLGCSVSGESVSRIHYIPYITSMHSYLTQNPISFKIPKWDKSSYQCCLYLNCCSLASLFQPVSEYRHSFFASSSSVDLCTTYSLHHFHLLF